MRRFLVRVQVGELAPGPPRPGAFHFDRLLAVVLPGEYGSRSTERMPCRRSPAYDRAMQPGGSYHPGPPRGGPPWQGGWFDESHQRAVRRGRLIFPVVLSLVIQLPAVFLTFGPDHRPEPLHLAPLQFWLD